MGQLANPGGERRRFVRTTLANWVRAQQIAGVTQVFRSMQPELPFEQSSAGVPLPYACMVVVRLGGDNEDRLAWTGPTDPGGKTVRYDASFLLYHRSFNPDSWEDDEDDYDRIVDALKDSIHGSGRDLGHPETLLSIGEFPRQGNVIHVPDDPVVTEDGSVDRWGTISFTVIEYLANKFP